MAALPRLLVADELPLPERMAARLDGELYALGDGHCPIDEAETPDLRLASVLRGRHPRLIAELATAAWVWGAATAPPRPELCVAVGARTRSAGVRGAGVREVVLAPHDVSRFAVGAVTTPLRTALDLARAREPFTTRDAESVRALALVGGFGLTEATAALDARRNLPERRRAAERLTAVLAPLRPP